MAAEQVQSHPLEHVYTFWRGYLLSACFLFLLLGGHTLAYGTEQNTLDNEIKSGEFRLHTPRGIELALLKSTDMEIKVNGMIARIIVKQVFENTSQEWIEGEYVFPLATNSAVDYMAMYVGERKIVGKIREKQEAKKIYEQAKQAGKKASLVVQQRPNLFTNRVANIGPGESITVELHYVETPQYDQGRFSLRLPTTLTQRYIPGQAFRRDTTFSQNMREENQNTTGNEINEKSNGWNLTVNRVVDVSAITPPMKTSNKAASLSLTAEINAGLPLDSIDSLYHPISIHQTQQNYQLTLKPGAKLDRDVVIEWTPETGKAPVAAVFRETIEQDDYLLLMIMPPQNIATSEVFPRETIFIIDTSGSMGGEAIEQAKHALLNGVDKLKPTDRFNIIEFNSTAKILWPQAVAATGPNILYGKNFVSGLNADGGTEMTAALDLAFQSSAPEGYIRQVIFITDGSVGNETGLFEQIRQSRGASRLFTVGIGSAPNSFFMQNAAEAGQGSYTYIGSQMDIARVMTDLFYKLENPVLSDIKIDFGSAVTETYPARLPDLYVGEPIIVAAKTSDPLPKDVVIRGVRAQSHTKQPFEQRLNLLNDAPAKDISKLWARKKLHDLYDDERNPAYRETARATELKKSITQLALDHQLMSKYTSFVAVEDVVSRPKTSPLQKHIEPNASPSGSTMPVPMPQGGLGLNALWMTALIALLTLILLHSGLIDLSNNKLLRKSTVGS